MGILIRRNALLSVLSAAMVIAALNAPTAVAQKDDEPGTGGPHCVGQAYRKGQEPALPVAPVCFPTFSEALAFATNGALVVGAGFTPLDLTDAMLNQAEQQQVQDLAVETTAVATVIGIEYWNQNYDTSNYTYTASVNDSGGCAGNTTWQIGYVGDFHNDKWSSAQNFQSCSRVPHFEHAQFNPNGGATRDCSPCSYIGDAMNNRTSSIRWRD